MSEKFKKTSDGSSMAGHSRVVLLSITAIAVFFLVLMLLEQAGMQDSYGYAITAALLAAAFVIPGICAGTIALDEWQVCRREVKPASLAMSLAATLISAGAFVALPGGFFTGNDSGPAYLLGPIAGAAITAFVVLPFLRKSAAPTPSGFFTRRYRGLAPSLAAAALVVGACVLMLWAQFEIAAAVSGIFFGFGGNGAILSAALIVAIAIVPGGLRGLIRTNSLAYLLIAASVLAPLAWLSAAAVNLPIPQFAYGAAATSETSELETQLAGLGLRPLAEATIDSLPQISGILPAGGLLLFLALGFVAFPPLLVHFSAARQVKSTRPTATLTIFLLALVVTAAPAAAAYAKLAIYNGIFGLTAGEIQQAASWVLEFGAFDAPLASGQALVTLCGQKVASVAEAVSACGGNPDYALSPADLRMHGEAVLLALAEMARLPSVFTMALGAGVVGAALATANASAFALASIVVFSEKSSGLRQLFLSRIAVLAGIAAAALLAMRNPAPPMDLAMWSLAFCAGGLAPAYLMAIWWDRINGIAASAGMACSVAVLCSIGLVSIFGFDLTYGNGGEALAAIPALSGLPLPVHAAFIAFGLSVTITAVISFTHARPVDAKLLERLRVPDAPAAEIP